jgi:hypothetical protein
MIINSYENLSFLFGNGKQLGLLLNMSLSLEKGLFGGAMDHVLSKLSRHWQRDMVLKLNEFLILMLGNPHSLAESFFWRDWLALINLGRLSESAERQD